MRGMIEMCCPKGVFGFVYSSLGRRREACYGTIGLAGSLAQTKGKMTMATDSKSLSNWNIYGRLLLVNRDFEWIKT